MVELFRISNAEEFGVFGISSRSRKELQMIHRGFEDENERGSRDDLTYKRCQWCDDWLSIDEVDFYDNTCGGCDAIWRKVFDPRV
jgi:hypothetical protein